MINQSADLARFGQPLRTLLRGSGQSLVLRVASAGLALSSQVIFARWLGAEQYGTFVFLTAVLGLLVLVGRLGFDGAAVRFVAYLKESAAVTSFVSAAISWSTLGTVVAALCLGLAAEYLRSSAGISVATTRTAATLIPALGLLQVVGGIARGRKRIILAQAPYEVLRPLILVGIVGLLLLHHAEGSSARLLFTLSGVTGYLVLLLAAWMTLRGFDRDSQFRFGLSVDRLWDALPFMLMAGMHLLILQTDVLILGLYVSKSEVGAYGAASRLALFATFGTSAINTIAAPMIASMSTADRPALQQVLSYAATGIFVFAILSWLGVVLFGDWMLSFFGPGFPLAFPALIVLVTGQLVNALTGSIGVVLSMTGHQRLLSALMVFPTIGNILLNLAFVRSYGMVGAAIASAVSLAIWNVSLVFLARKKTGVDPSFLSLALIRRGAD
ncbi:MAG: oligosaccharide flippase family protein [Gemmatimonadales bacterium]